VLDIGKAGHNVFPQKSQRYKLTDRLAGASRNHDVNRRCNPRWLEVIMTTNILRNNLESCLEVHSRLLDTCLPALTAAADALISAYSGGHKALFFGNGGSAADAQHLAAEFLGRYLRERRPLPAVALHANSSALTAIANDYGYEHVFARQLEALAVRGDVAVGISTSGNSPNVIEAMTCARRLGLVTIALTGGSGGRLRSVVDILIAVPSEETPRIQECHILIGHALCDAVEQALGAEDFVANAHAVGAR
jgi:D-sedoheptulose 7-phosphate isomerase